MGNLERKNYQAIAKDLGEPLDEIIEAVKVIMSFDPKPGRLYSEEEPIYITPDVYVYKIGDKYFVVPNDDGLPKLKISNFYRQALKGGQQARQYVEKQKEHHRTVTFKEEFRKFLVQYGIEFDERYVWD